MAVIFKNTNKKNNVAISDNNNNNNDTEELENNENLKTLKITEVEPNRDQPRKKL